MYMGANHAGCMGEALGALGVPTGQLRVSIVKVSQVATSRLLDGIHEVVSRIHVPLMNYEPCLLCS